MIGCGMNVIASDPFMEKATIDLSFFDGQTASFTIETISKDTLLKQADFITLHVPAQKEYLIGKNEFEMMKVGAMIVNAASSGVIDEIALIEALDSGKSSFAELDVLKTNLNLRSKY